MSRYATRQVAVAARPIGRDERSEEHSLCGSVESHGGEERPKGSGGFTYLRNFVKLAQKFGRPRLSPQSIVAFVI